MNKKGMELAISFFVTLIIALVVFSGSIYIVKQFFTTATETRENIDRQTEAEIQSLLREGTPVAIPLSKKRIVKGKSDTFWVGIENILEQDNEFYVRACFSNAFDTNGQIMIEPEAGFIENNWILYSEGPHAIPKNDFKAVSIFVNVDQKSATGIRTEKGTYTFNVYVGKDIFFDTCDQLRALSIGELNSLPYLYYDKRPRRLTIEV